MPDSIDTPQPKIEPASTHSLKDEFAPLDLGGSPIAAAAEALTLLDVDGDGKISATEAANDALVDEAYAALVKLGLSPEAVFAAFGIATPEKRRADREERSKGRSGGKSKTPAPKPPTPKVTAASLAKKFAAADLKAKAKELGLATTGGEAAVAQRLIDAGWVPA